MAQYEEHSAKRQRVDDGGNDLHSGGGYNSGNAGGGTTGYEEKQNHVLLITVYNPAYPVTTDVIHTICSPSGKVLRIVIFKKNGVQAMVEFDSIESAERAKQSLNGCDIYSGCCTLKIEFAKPKRLNVYKNDTESWDYTGTLGVLAGGDRPALLSQPPRTGPGYGPPDSRGPEPYDSHYDEGYMPPRGARPHPYGPPVLGPYGGPLPPELFEQDPHGREGPPIPGFGPGAPMAPPIGNQGSVMMAYELNYEKMNCDKLFNIMCLYGNVLRIKFLKSKEGSAMIQMGDPGAVYRAISNLNGSAFFGSKLRLGNSKQPFVNVVQIPFTLPDGTPSFKDFFKSRNNRFSNPEAASKNRILPPSQMLHFYNAPFGIDEEGLKKIFEDKDAKVPQRVKLFVSKDKPEKSSSGLLEYDNVSDAIEALAICNHVPVNHPDGKYPYTFKLCFSSSSSGPGYRVPIAGFY